MHFTIHLESVALVICDGVSYSFVAISTSTTTCCLFLFPEIRHALRYYCRSQIGRVEDHERAEKGDLLG